MSADKVEQVWQTIAEKVCNNVKVYLLKGYSNEVLSFFTPKIEAVSRRYARYLPHYVADSEIDDLRTIAKLEFLETLKVWQPSKSADVWPLAQARIVGAMKDHIRYITRTDPSRYYEWVTDAAYMFLATSKRADFEKTVENGMQLNQAMKVLTERERKIVVTHTKEDLTFKQIGLNLGVSESQISRIYKKSLEKLKKELSKP